METVKSPSIKKEIILLVVTVIIISVCSFYPRKNEFQIIENEILYPSVESQLCEEIEKVIDYEQNDSLWRIEIITVYLIDDYGNRKSITRVTNTETCKVIEWVNSPENYCIHF